MTQIPPIGINDIAWSPDGEKFAVAGGEWQCRQGLQAYGIKIFDVSTEALLHTLEGHTCTVITIEWSPNGNYLVSGGLDGVARVWDATTGNLVSSTDIFSPTGRVNQSWSPDGSLIADNYGSNSIIYIWNPMTGQPVSIYESNERLSEHKWNSDSNNSLLAIGVFNGVQILDPNTMTIVKSLPTSIPAGDIIELAWSPDSSQIAGGSVEGSIHVWDIVADAEISLLVGHTEPILDLAWSPDGTSIISSALDNTVRVWDTTTNQQIEIFETQGFSSAIDWSPDGTQISFSGNPEDGLIFGVEIVPAPSLCDEETNCDN